MKINNNGLKRISFWKRLKDYRHVALFGADQLPATLGRLPLPINDQGTSEYCTAFATSGAGGFLNGLPMAAEWQTASEGVEAGAPIFDGTDPHTALDAALHRGFLPAASCPLLFAVQGFQTPAIWASYAQDVDNISLAYKPGSFTSVSPNYDSIKEALFQAKDDNGVVMAFGYWYEEFNTAAATPSARGIVPVPTTSPISRHAYIFIDWKTIDGTEYLVAQLSQGSAYGDGGLLYFSESVVNALFANPIFNGLGCYIFRTQAQTTIEINGLYRQAIELLREIVSMLTPVQGTAPSLSTLATELRLMLVALGILRSMELTTEPVVPVAQNIPLTRVSKIHIWALAIAVQEGAKKSLNNPGNLKVSTLTKSWGATNGFQATDGGWIAAFPTAQAGETALENFLTLGCEDELIAFHTPEARTLGGFTQIYAGNPPPEYAEAVGRALGCPLDTQISSFIT